MTTTNLTTSDELVILVDENDQETGTAEKIYAHKNNLLHRAFSVFIFSQDGAEKQLLLQQRAQGKYHSGGLWTNTCCSHPRPGEDIISAGERRLKEELGLTATLKDMGWFHYNAHFSNGLAENEIDHVLVGAVYDWQRIELNPDEIQDYRWITVRELKSEMKQHPERFTPWLKQALELV